MTGNMIVTTMLAGAAMIGGLTFAAGQGAAAGAPRLYRIIMPVSDLEASARFYAALLGMEGTRIAAAWCSPSTIRRGTATTR